MNQSRRGRGGKRARNNPKLAQVVIAGSSQCSYVLTERQFLVQDDPKIPDRSGEEKGREFSRKGLRVQLLAGAQPNRNFHFTISYIHQSSFYWRMLFHQSNWYNYAWCINAPLVVMLPLWRPSRRNTSERIFKAESKQRRKFPLQEFEPQKFQSPVSLYDIRVVWRVVYSKCDSRLNHVTGGLIVFEILRPPVGPLVTSKNICPIQ